MAAVEIVLDTSVALNLLATGASQAILESLEVKCFVCSAAIAETLHIRSGDPTQPVEAVSTNPWLQSNIVQTVSPDGLSEEELYLQFAADLDDGEAMSLAICRSRGYALATDDRKARRLAGQLPLPAIQLISTSQIVHHWAERTVPHKNELKRLLAAIERKARFIPPHDDALREWWIRSRSEL